MNPLLRFALFCWFFPVGACFAGLAWEKEMIEVAGLQKDGVLKAVFHYRNTGEREVRIRSVKTTCGCTVARPDSEIVEPGSEGNLEVTYKIGRRLGYYETPVTVKTDDPVSPVQVLKLRLRVRSEVDVYPTFLFWKTGEEREAKSLMVEVGDGKPLESLKADCKEPGIRLGVEELKPGLLYRVSVQPEDPPRRAVVKLYAMRDGRELKRMLVRVRLP